MINNDYNNIKYKKQPLVNTENKYTQFTSSDLNNLDREFGEVISKENYATNSSNSIHNAQDSSNKNNVSNPIFETEDLE